jgi:hypothetical protein
MVVSKILSQLRNDLLIVNKCDWGYFENFNTGIFVLNLPITSKYLPTSRYGSFSVTADESVYTGGNYISNYKIRNTSITLNYLNSLNKIHHSPTVFNFNIKSNLDMANQQRWLTKNSLLTESIVHNSFIFTQAKKLIGTGLLNKDFTNQTLWLPTKSAHLSPTETSLYFNNLLSNVDNFFNSTNTLKTHQITNSYFNNLNFFENSRLWLMKKYFFTNNINNNIVYELPKYSHYGIFTSNSKDKRIPTKLMFNLGLYKTSLGYLTKSTLSPSLNSIDGSVLLTTSTVPYNLLNVTTPNLDIFNSNTNQFFFLLTSNLNSTDRTIYYNYLQSNVVKPEQINTTKFTVM